MPERPSGIGRVGNRVRRWKRDGEAFGVTSGEGVAPVPFGGDIPSSRLDADAIKLRTCDAAVCEMAVAEAELST